MTLVETVREYFPDADDDEVNHLIWSETGYPAFWDIPRTGATPQDVFLIQIARAAARENFGEFGYFDAERSMDLAFEEMRARSENQTASTTSAAD